MSYCSKALTLFPSLSTDGGFTFQLIQNEIQNGDIRKDFGILKSTLNPDKVRQSSYLQFEI